MIWIYTILVLTTLITILNFLTVQRIKKRNIITHEKISVIIPARNEAKRIAALLTSLQQQSKKPFEIIVVDDNSTDETAHIAKKYGAKVVSGKKLPTNWKGKNYAAHQGAHVARGDILCFFDADVVLEPQFIKYAVETLKTYNLGMLSCFPKQVTKSFGEKLMVPLMKWLLLSTLVLRTVMLSTWTSLSAANGQCLIFTRTGYDRIGGWKAVANSVVDDIAFVKEAKRKGVRRATTISNYISCRMYSSGKQALQGFGKNFFEGTSLHPLSFIILLSVLSAGLVLPLFFGIYGWILLYVQRILLQITIKSRDISQLLLTPIQPIVLFIVGLYSLITTTYGTREWKGRKL